VKLDDIGFLPLTASTNTVGCSLDTGKSLIITRRLASGDRTALAAREVVNKLTEYLLSEPGQRALLRDQFEIPSRPGILAALTTQEVTAIYGARRTGLDDQTYLKKLKSGELAIDEESMRFGVQTLQLLRQMEATLNDPAYLRLVRTNRLSMSQCILIDRMLHEALPKSENNSPPAEALRDEKVDPITTALHRLQERLEVNGRFFPVLQPNRNPLVSSAP